MATRAGRPPTPAPALLLLLTFLFLLRGVLPSRAGDTVAAGRPLSDAQSLVSKRGKFKLEFFRPGTQCLLTSSTRARGGFSVEVRRGLLLVAPVAPLKIQQKWSNCEKNLGETLFASGGIDHHLSM
uniref:Uncharacterized protein n=1 Tax=Zea mays TaxID=4577 RepID=B6SQH3_MAIZE|nr:hypothetical protein [Zea mays]